MLFESPYQCQLDLSYLRAERLFEVNDCGSNFPYLTSENEKQTYATIQSCSPAQ